MEKRMPNLQDVETFHRKKKEIKKIILSKTGKHEIIFGQRAVNKRVPDFLDRPTTDYDIFTPTPKKDAKQTENALDKHMGFNAFEIVPAKHEGTHKVKSLIDGETYADYTKPDKKVPYEKIGKHNYIKLAWIKKQIGKTLKDPTSSFRHDKDKDTLNRIKIYEKLKQNPTRKKGVRKQKTSRQIRTRSNSNPFQHVNKVMKKMDKIAKGII